MRRPSIGIFHGSAAYLTLNDKAYGAYRLVETGNPYKKLLASLMEQGIQIEECAISMRSNGWGNIENVSFSALILTELQNTI